jgi:hypothetical protein
MLSSAIKEICNNSKCCCSMYPFTLIHLNTQKSVKDPNQQQTKLYKATKNIRPFYMT